MPKFYDYRKARPNCDVPQQWTAEVMMDGMKVYLGRYFYRAEAIAAERDYLLAYCENDACNHGICRQRRKTEKARKCDCN